MELADTDVKALLDSAPDALIIVDAAGQIVFANAQSAALFGSGPDELVGQPVETLLPERFRAAHVSHREGYFALLEPRPMGAGLQLFGLRQDGSEFPVEISLSPLEQASGCFVLTAIRDVTDRRLEEQKLRELLDSAPDAMVVVNRSGNIILVNSQTEVLFGYARATLIGEPVESLLPERFRNSHSDHRHRFFNSPNVRPMGAGLQLFGRRSDGSEFPVEISLSPVHTSGDMLVSAGIRDVTDRKDIEKALIAARDEAERANRGKSVFLATASHDLRQPLQTLRLLNAVLAKTVADPRAAKAVASQAEALAAMADLLNALLDISKLESGAIKPDIADCNIQAIFSRLRSAFELQAQAKGLNLLVEDCGAVVRTDATLLERIIENLIANAIRYTRKGLVRLRCLARNGNVRIEVFDTGIGIPVNELDAIFEEFYQLNREPGHKREGLGLGLSIVKRLASLLEYPLEVESTPGEGTCFSVTVPRGAASSAETGINIDPESTPARAAKVLIIDDDRAVADATAMLLEIEGHEVMLASTSEEALAAVSARGIPDLIVSDFHLGGDETGIDVVRRLRAEAGLSIPVILTTGDTSSLVTERIEAARPCRILSKPVDTDELMKLIQELAGFQ